MKDEKIEPVLADLKVRLAKLYGERLEQVVLFGSQARGDAREDSDIDVLVVLKGEVNHTKELEQISFITAELSGQCGRLISTVVVSKKDYDTRTCIVYDNAARGGDQAIAMNDDSQSINFRTFSHAMKIWVVPDILKRIDRGDVKQADLPIEIRAFRFLQWKDKEGSLNSKVELNEEFNLIVEVKLRGEGQINKGDPVKLDQIDPTQVFLQLPNIDGMRASFFFVIRQYLGFTVAFDFTPLNPLPGDLGPKVGVPFDIKSHAITTRNLATINAPLQMERLSKSSWPPSPGYFPNILLQMAQNAEFENSEKMNDSAKQVFSREYFAERIKEWREYNVLGGRIECVEHCIERHFSKDFRSAIFVITPQFEGIVSDYLKRNNIKICCRHEERVEQLISLLMGRGAILFPKSILDATLKFLQEGTFWKYSGRVKNKSEEINRHGIAHGEFVNFESEDLSLRFLIFLDGLCFLLFHDMIVSGKLVE